MNGRLLLPKNPQKERTHSVLSGVGILSAAATVVVFSAFFFSEVSLSATLGLSLDFLLLFFSSYIMYYSMFETGMDKASAADVFQALCKRRETLFDRYRTEGDTESIFAFCRAVSEKETHALRRDLLIEHWMTEAELASLQSKPPEERTRAEQKLLKRLQRQKPVRITPQMLLAEKANAKHFHAFAHSPAQMRLRRTLLFLIPTALTAIFSVSLVFHVIRDPSIDIIVGYLFKLFTLFFNGMKGFCSGFSHIENEKSDYMREQCFWLDAYFAHIAPTTSAD